MSRTSLGHHSKLFRVSRLTLHLQRYCTRAMVLGMSMSTGSLLDMGLFSQSSAKSLIVRNILSLVPLESAPILSESATLWESNTKD